MGWLPQPCGIDCYPTSRRRVTRSPSHTRPPATIKNAVRFHDRVPLAARDHHLRLACTPQNCRAASLDGSPSSRAGGVGAKDSFIADVSHELRTSLTGIFGFASALEDERASLPPFAAELVGLIVTEAVELSRMVDYLVAAGRIDAEAITFEFEPVELLGEIKSGPAPIGPARDLGRARRHHYVGLGGSSSTAAGAAKPHLECGQTRGTGDRSNRLHER